MSEETEKNIPADELVRVTFLPEGKTVEFEFGTLPYESHGEPMSILDVAENNDIFLDHACGGVCACSTCHVLIKAGASGLTEADDDELDRLDMAADQQLNSRLGCQAVITRPGDYVVEIPAWNRNYGNGPIDDSVPGQPSVGGYMCWDWANIFEDALSPLHLKCASFQEGIAATGMLILNGEPGRRVHYFVKIYVGNMDVDSMRVNFDDGFIEGKAANPGAFPMNSQYQEINRADYPGLSRPSYNPFIPAIPNPYVTETASWPGKHPPPSS